MIVAKLELWPGGDQKKMRPLGQMILINDESGTADRGNYHVAVLRRDALRTTTRGNPGGAVAREGRVENFPRKSYNVWRLVSRALRSAFPEEK